jgi:uncharacterized protein DUF5681
MPFQPGQSGNPAGRPRGCRNKRTVLLENILHGEGETIMRKLIELANRGELGAIRMCMDRLLPAAKGESVACDMPPMNNPMDAVAAMTGVFEALRVGDLTSAEADKVAKLVHTWMRTMVVVTHEARIREIEKQKGIADLWLHGEPAESGDDAAGEPAAQDAEPSGSSEMG